ncbi:nuclear pore complex protein Nup210 [Marchantia polymorpha subsp. ruderalis]|uniref:BIG2 domain-containing protein n=4 Tax=Marchantia polymorpha TaxID=3197 RepID=A0AAF6AM90_MARPO|nr:hypothetical protein MARPO_0043s0050 [Marchantia polymorpha]BBM97560.1 hypothetical protein Mp_1g06580 [Marchantia polymorpha subsp. ruderalis]|eukprot:PTQ39801.1 hypothetical protein MARPO_0043s0050 [Marchantia polymorpha]
MMLFGVFVLLLNVLISGLQSPAQAALSAGQHQGPHISSLNLLLPPRTTRPVRYRLHGSNGCFTWSWDHHDLLSVEPEFNGTVKHCSTSALITSIASYAGRRATAVHATDIITGQVLRCEVFVDKLSRIRIFHHSLKLDLDGLAALRIRAFDSEENVFSSLVGLQFMWQLSPLNPVGESLSHKLTHVPLKDTALEDEEIETQIQLEQTGLDSDLYVVRGISAGQERITAQLLEPNFEDLVDVVVLTVAEAVSLEPPSPLYIIPGTHLQYTLKTVRRNQATVVELPSPYHHWFIINSTVAEIDPFMGTVVGRTHGVTTVVVEDTRVAGHQQTSTLHVVTPVSLRLYLTPLSASGVGARPLIKEPPIMSSDVPWQLVVGRKYVVQVFTFSRESGTRPLQLTKDNDLRRMYDNEGVWVVDDIPEDVAAEQGWQNCSLIHSIKEGTGNLIAILAHGSMVQDEVTGQWFPANKEVLREEQKVRVCSPVRIVAPFLEEIGTVSLPWIPGHSQQYRLSVEGGCGEKAADFWWSSSTPTIATVDAQGVVRSQGLGKAVIRVSAVRDSLNFDEAVVDVSLPSFINVVPGLPVEVEVPSSLPVAVHLRTSEGKLYSRCDSFSPLVQWDIFGGDSSFVQLNKTSQILPLLHSAPELGADTTVGGPDNDQASACAWTLLLATRSGRATITALLDIRKFLTEARSPEYDPHQQILETSWTIAAFMPLSLQQVGDGNRFGGYAVKGGDYDTATDALSGPKGSLKELLLVVGSSMRIKVHGGPERWRQGVEFVESCLDEIRGLETPSGITINHLNEGSGRVYLLTCTGLGNHTLVFTRGNLVGDDHPKRAVASASLSMICAIPTSISLLIDEPENSHHLIKVAAQADRDTNRVRTIPFTVINGRTIRVSAVAMSSSKAFANASSLMVRWPGRDCEGLAKWEPVSDFKPTHEEGSWERFLTLGSVSGECILKATVAGFLSNSHLERSILSDAENLLAARKPLLKDAVPLQLVTALRLEPKSLLLFLHPNAKGSFLLLGGTSDVESQVHDPKVAVLSHQPPTSGRLQLVLGAKGLGSTLVSVRDVGLATPSETSGTVLVADVAWVKMLIPEDASLLLGSNMTIHLEVGDGAGHTFDASQLAYMNVQVHTLDEVVEVVKPPRSSPGELSASTFVIRGASVGLTTTLHVSVQKFSGHEVLSDYGRISVFAPLSIHPPSLVIAPGSQYVLSAQGGPRVGASIDFMSSNEEVATIDRISGRLEAVAHGTATIFAQARGQGGLVITEDSVEVRVQLLFTPTLNVKGGQLGVNREMSIFPTEAEEDLLSFYELCSDYKWSITDEQVLALKHGETRSSSLGDGAYANESNDALDRKRALSGHVYGQEGMLGTEEGFSARIVGRSAGRAKVTVAFSCSFGNQNGIVETRDYSASETIWVVPDPPLALGIPATWLLRPQYTSSSLLPQWTGQFPARIDNGNFVQSVQYTVMHEGSSDLGVISISEDGRIRTSERLEVACIHARDRNTARTEVAACVRVAEVAQLTVGGNIFPYHVAELSVGSSQQYTVTLADEFGTPFFESGRGSSLLVLETNRADIVTAKVTDCEQHETSCSLTITVQALRQGTALVRVSYKGLAHITDFILIKVGAFVSPRNPSVHVGGRVNFTIIGKGVHVAGQPRGERGHWASDNPNVLEIDRTTGCAKAVGEGNAIVSFTGSRLTTYTSVNVIRISSVTLEAPKNVVQVTNMPFHEEGYRFPVQFSDTQGLDAGVVGESREVSYECQLKPAFLGLVVPWREPGFNSFYCVFFAYTPQQLWYNVHRSEENQKIVSSGRASDGTIQMTITAVVPGNPPVEGSIETSMTGGFEIINTPQELHLSPTTNRSLITIVGNTGKVKVSWGRNDVMVVEKLSDTSPNFGIAARANFEVKLISEDHPFTDRLVFSLLPSGQEEERFVIYSAELLTRSLFVKPILYAVVLVVILIVLPLILCARLLDLPQPTAEQAPPTEGAESSVSDGPLYSTSFGEQTPPPTRGFSRTPPPQPYTDYVKRTIEKTPYYKREGVRKFDPYRTY